MTCQPSCHKCRLLRSPSVSFVGIILILVDSLQLSGIFSQTGKNYGKKFQAFISTSKIQAFFKPSNHNVNIQAIPRISYEPTSCSTGFISLRLLCFQITQSTAEQTSVLLSHVLEFLGFVDATSQHNQKM